MDRKGFLKRLGIGIGAFFMPLFPQTEATPPVSVGGKTLFINPPEAGWGVVFPEWDGKSDIAVELQARQLTEKEWETITTADENGWLSIPPRQVKKEELRLQVRAGTNQPYYIGVDGKPKRNKHFRP